MRNANASAPNKEELANSAAQKVRDAAAAAKEAGSTKEDIEAKARAAGDAAKTASSMGLEGGMSDKALFKKEVRSKNAHKRHAKESLMPAFRVADEQA